MAVGENNSTCALGEQAVTTDVTRLGGTGEASLHNIRAVDTPTTEWPGGHVIAWPEHVSTAGSAAMSWRMNMPRSPYRLVNWPEPLRPSIVDVAPVALRSPRRFLSAIRFSFDARVGFVARRFFGITSAARTSAASRASADRRFCCWLLRSLATTRTIPSESRRAASFVRNPLALLVGHGDRCRADPTAARCASTRC